MRLTVPRRLSTFPRTCASPEEEEKQARCRQAEICVIQQAEVIGQEGQCESQGRQRSRGEIWYEASRLFREMFVRMWFGEQGWTVS